MTDERLGEPRQESAAGELALLRSENAELRRRAEATERLIEELRAEALARRVEVRRLAEALPLAMSRHALVRSMLRDVRHHPDKRDVVRRGLRKGGRGVRKVARKLARGVRKAMRMLRRDAP